MPPHYVSKDATVQNSLVSGGCKIEGDIDYSVMFANVTVEEGANVRYSIVMPGATIKKGATVQYAMIAEDAVIESGAVVGEDPEKIDELANWGVTVIGAKVNIGENVKSPAKAMIAEDVKGGDAQ